MTDTNALNHLIDQSGLKRSYIAEYLGITPYGLSRKIMNYSEFKASEIDKLCKLLNIDSYDQMRSVFFLQSA